MAILIVVILFALGAIAVISAATKIVPQQQAWVVERLGRYHTTLRAGLNVIVPFIDSVRERHSLKETVIKIDEQDCITRDNVLIKVDAVLYYQIIDPVKASYGIEAPKPGFS